MNLLQWWSNLGPGEQPAWAQAGLSIVAVAIAVWVPARSARLERRRRALAILSLLDAIRSESAVAIGIISGPFHPSSLDRPIGNLKRLIEAAEAIPVHETAGLDLALPSFELLGPARELQGGLFHVSRLMTEMNVASAAEIHSRHAHLGEEVGRLFEVAKANADAATGGLVLKVKKWTWRRIRKRNGEPVW